MDDLPEAARISMERARAVKAKRREERKESEARERRVSTEPGIDEEDEGEESQC